MVDAVNVNCKFVTIRLAHDLQVPTAYAVELAIISHRNIGIKDVHVQGKSNTDRTAPGTVTRPSSNAYPQDTVRLETDRVIVVTDMSSLRSWREYVRPF
jgi:hypothetical protein